MSDIQVQTIAEAEGVLTVLTHLWNGQLSEVIASLADQFQFKDWGIGLEFKDKECLAQFFQEARELYPDSSLEIDGIYVGGERVIAEWALKTSLIEPYSSGCTFFGLGRILSMKRYR